VSEDPPTAGVGPACPAPLLDHDRIVLGHGSGGRLTGDLVARLFHPLLANPVLLAGDDAAILPGVDGRLAVSTDAHVVKPLFFPGGDIGRLAVCGTVNDLAMVGARPRWIAAAFVIEEGLPIADLERIVRSMREAADEAGVAIVAGDTKVAGRGDVDGLYVTTTGVGTIPAGRDVNARNVRPGDAVIVSGPLGDHGIAVLAARGDLGFETTLVSDTAPLGALVEALFDAGVAVHALRDLTRGGLAAAVNELAASSGVAIELEESAIPVRDAVRAACEMLGFDPLHVANEGKLVAFVPGEEADRALAALRAHARGAEARSVGHVAPKPAGRVSLRTPLGAARVLDVPAGELLPRIC
jgi:hydrogenase expression/formation protein HypE